MLEGKIILVTGASRGISRQVVLTLGREGASVIANYNGSAVKAEEVMKEVEAAGGKVEAVQCSVSDFESCSRMMVNVVSRYGRLDTLVNNAGITRDNLLMKMSEEGFNAVISTNLKGVPNCIKHISRQILKQKAGRIINISSVSGVLGSIGQTSYCTAKAGIAGITKSVTKEPANRRIMVNIVASGFIVTETTDALSDSIRAVAMEQIPMKHFRSTQDVAETIVFLASDKAGCITGQVLSVDGGMAMQDDLEYLPG